LAELIKMERGTELMFVPLDSVAIYLAAGWKEIGRGPMSTDSAFLSEAANAMFGSGFDGDVVITVDTILTRPMFYNNLTITAGTVWAYLNAPFVFVKDTLIIATGAVLRDSLSDDGADGTNATGEAAGVGGAGGGMPTLVSGGAGGNGNGIGAAGAAGLDNFSSWPSEQFLTDGHPIGGNGGGGPGGGLGGAGGPSGALTKIAGMSPAVGIVRHPFFFSPMFAIDGGFKSSPYPLLALGGAAGGGGGGEPLTGHGGGGGGGGGYGGGLFVFARHIQVAGKLCADGGDGGDGGNGTAGWGGGGGGGAGGGYICVVTKSIDNPGLVTARAGLGGTGGIGLGGNGTDGQPGEAGLVDLYY